jgi:hypothetical protein
MAFPILNMEDLVLHKLLLILFRLLTHPDTASTFDVTCIVEPRACLNATCKRLYKLMPHATIREMLTTQVREIRAKFFEHVVETGMHVMKHCNCMDFRGDGDPWAMTFTLRMGTMDICVYTMFRNRGWSDYFVNFYVIGDRHDQPTCHHLTLFDVPDVIEVPLADRTPQQIEELAQWTAQKKEKFVKHLLKTFETINFTCESRFVATYDRTEFTRASRARYLLLRL